MLDGRLENFDKCYRWVGAPGTMGEIVGGVSVTGRKGREVDHAVEGEMGSKWSGWVRVEGFEERGEWNEMRNGLNPAYGFCHHGILCHSSAPLRNSKISGTSAWDSSMLPGVGRRNDNID